MDFMNIDDPRNAQTGLVATMLEITRQKGTFPTISASLNRLNNNQRVRVIIPNGSDPNEYPEDIIFIEPQGERDRDHIKPTNEFQRYVVTVFLNFQKDNGEIHSTHGTAYSLTPSIEAAVVRAMKYYLLFRAEEWKEIKQNG